jgi:hypothetical protein
MVIKRKCVVKNGDKVGATKTHLSCWGRVTACYTDHETAVANVYFFKSEVFKNLWEREADTHFPKYYWITKSNPRWWSMWHALKY